MENSQTKETQKNFNAIQKNIANNLEKKQKKELTMREKRRYEGKIISAFISVIGLILCLIWIFLSKYFGY
tara:strand:+ start:425 stop:634 length:210 start_codon:yes stop_codon:yes gene_type:complete